MHLEINLIVFYLKAYDNTKPIKIFFFEYAEWFLMSQFEVLATEGRFYWRVYQNLL